MVFVTGDVMAAIGPGAKNKNVFLFEKENKKMAPSNGS